MDTQQNTAGRFYSNDPVGFTGEPDTFNRYSYVANNPYKYTDPTGEAKYKGDKSGIAAGNLIARGVVAVTEKGSPINNAAQRYVDVTNKLIYNDSGYKKHGNSPKKSSGEVISPKPTDGQAALDNSVPLGKNTDARVGVDVNNKEVVILKNNGTPSKKKHCGHPTEHSGQGIVQDEHRATPWTPNGTQRATLCSHNR